MTEQYQRVQPTPFDAPAETPASAGPTVESRPQWLLPALAGLGVLALIVVFALPRWVDSSVDSPREPGGATVSTKDPASIKPQASVAASSETTEQASPFADARAAKARAEAQELLGELLDVQENLEQRGAQEWASDAMQSIAAQALAGDELYRDREFDAAIAQYQQALGEALALEQSLPERFAQQIEATGAAIESLDAQTATSSLAIAEQLDPGTAEAASLAARLQVLPDLTAAVTAATDAETAGDLAGAVSSIQAAANLDGAHQYVAAELQRLKGALTEQRFNTAMSEGYAALDEADFTSAQKRFERAGALDPGSSEAAAALAELSVARTAATLQRLQNSGNTLLQDEDWNGAIKVFEEALAIDQSLRFAREGLAVAKPRGQIEKELSAIVQKPERLVDDAILGEAKNSVARAKSLDGLGPRLSAQVKAVEDILVIASTPLPVTISSDGLTEVTVYKVARLGLLDRRQLSLRPGQYTAVGSRRGYRDARVTFTVSPAQTAPVFIACSEAI